MSIPVPSMDDICNGITASGCCSGLLQRIEALRNFVFLWQDSRQQPDDFTSGYLQSMEIMLEDIYSRACDVEKSLEPFSEYMR